MIAHGLLDLSLLYRIMKRVGDPQDFLSTFRTDSFFDLLSQEKDLDKRRSYLARHLTYLEEREYIAQPPSTVKTNPKRYQLTAKGHEFLQPELTEFGREPVLPRVVESLEKEIQILTYPKEDKDKLIYKLRDAIAKETPDVIAKVIAEIGFKIFGSRL
jgi:DNA-binding MarR family transcriptional regulator